MTDAEVICEWMESPPPNDPDYWSPTDDYGYYSPGGWWVMSEAGMVFARALTLDRLREVEERLTDNQVGLYDAKLREAIRNAPIRKHCPAVDCFTWHASAEIRIAALAAVLRGER